MTSTEEKISSLRSKLGELSNFQLPDHYKRQADAIAAADANESTAAAATTEEAEAYPNPRLLKRYRTARNTYIHRRTLQMFVEMMSNYDPATNTFALPTVSPADKDEQRRKNEEVLHEIRATMDKINRLRKDNVDKYQEFEKKKTELADIVDKMERAAETTEEEDDNEEMSEEVTQEQVEAQEEELSKLSERREMLQHKLRLIRGQIAQVEGEVSETQKAVNEVRVKTGRKPLDWEDVEYFSTKESVDAELTEMRTKIEELKRSTEFYDGMRDLMEELGGVKVLECAQDDDSDGYSIKFMLLDTHILQLHLEHHDGALRVRDAKLLTCTTLPVPQINEEDTTNLMETIHSISVNNLSFSKLVSQNKPTQTIDIRPLDDLVSYSRELESSHGIRFVVSETLARIRTAQARMAELSQLKKSYAYQVYNVDSSQEVVCALNEGISVALRLGADCPLVKGSVDISELCGVGGWEEDKLAELRSVVDEMRCRGPCEVMEVLSEEIKKRTEEDGWKLPLTPVLMRGSSGD